MREIRSYRQTFGTRQNGGDNLHIGFFVEPELLFAIKRFRDKGNYPSTASAIRELIRRGLEKK